ncbi:FIG006045: Sigma factor, ECF subfamily [plant metagenome]|uniref:FIG006045: Sigma factor, ECF subfamily n=1 Tax=plant metagenome TaxID=1297885 RepID=A0A484UM02_9ZZZZ
MSSPVPLLAGWLSLYREFMQAYAPRFGDRRDAEDAAHDAIEQLLTRGDVTTLEHARHFLFRAAAHRRIDAWRRESRHTHISLDELPEHEHPCVPSPEAEVRAAQLMEALVGALEALPLNCRRAYVLNRIEGWTHKEIAATLALSVNSIERYVMRACRHVRQALDPHAWQ